MRQREVFVFWLPLFASWLLMTAEGPLLTAAINRLPNEVVMLAAMGIVVGLSVTIESPIINLLATATALVADRPSYLLMRRFTIHWMVGLTGVGALLAWSPLFDLVVLRALGTPAEVARWVRPGLGILVPWTAAIAWRRFLQGVLIHFKQTKAVGRGTAVRLVATVGCGYGLALWSDWPGIHLGATALLVGVFTEAIYATLAVRPVLRALPEKARGDRPTLDYRTLMRFHLPLATTSVLTLLVQPLITSTLTRLDRPTETLAAWPLVFQLMLVMRAAAFALPEVVIALDGPESQPALRRFSLSLAGFSLLAMGLFSFSPLAELYLFRLQDAAFEVGTLTAASLAFFTPLPALAVIVSWLRGQLISARRTDAVNGGMLVRLGVTLVVLALALGMRWPGLHSAAAAVVLPVTVEATFLLWWEARRRPRPSLSEREP